jgi:hypothetical protein
MLVTLALVGSVERFNVADYRVRFTDQLGLHAEDIFVHSVSDGILVNVCRMSAYCPHKELW